MYYKTLDCVSLLYNCSLQQYKAEGCNYFVLHSVEKNQYEERRNTID